MSERLAGITVELSPEDVATLRLHICDEVMQDLGWAEMSEEDFAFWTGFMDKLGLTKDVAKYRDQRVQMETEEDS